MTQPLTSDELAALRDIDSPTVSNAIEVFDVRPRNEGFMTPDIRSLFPEMGPMVGYAATAVISAAGVEGHTVPRWDLWDHVLTIPEPRVLVIHDVDEPVCGAFWGEVQSNIFKALGCMGSITDGSVRDLDEVQEVGFQLFAKWVSVSHAYVRVIDAGVPVMVGGLLVRPGDLLHGDKHGVVSIPPEIARDIPSAARQVGEREHKIIEHCNSPDFNLKELRRLVSAPTSQYR